MGAPAPREEPSVRWRELVSNGLLVAAAGLLSWGLAQIVSHGERLTALEATTIRGADAQTMWVKIGEHEQRLVALETGLSTPMAKDTRALFDAQEHRLHAIEDELRQSRLRR